MELPVRYECLRELGRGASGSVYLVRDRYREQELALKLVRSIPGATGDSRSASSGSSSNGSGSSARLEDLVAQLEREYALLSELEHPRVARAYDFGFVEGAPYFTSEYVRGTPLDRVIDERSATDRDTLPDAASALRLARELAEAVAYLHRHQILHLDIKPSNVVVRDTAAVADPVLIDFGLVRRGLRGAPGSRLRGSCRFMAPEYFHGDAIGPWTDVYALGVTLYRVVAGAYPRWNDGTPKPEQLFDGDWTPLPPDACARGFEVPSRLQKVLGKCLALSPRRRYQSAAEVLEALAFAGGEPLASSAGAPRRTVGRAVALEHVERFLDAARGGAGPRALALTGAHGAGLSHLLRDVKLRAERLGMPVCLETAFPGRVTAPGALFRCLEPFLGAGERTSQSLARWRAFLARLRKPVAAGGSIAPDRERRARRVTALLAAARELPEPLVLAIDDAQHCDEVSIELLVGLAHELRRAPDAAPLVLVVGFREEGPARPLLRELGAVFLEDRFERGPSDVLTLGPLPLVDTVALWEQTSGRRLEPSAAVTLFQETAGEPARIVARASGSDEVSDGEDRPERPAMLRDTAGLAGLDNHSVDVVTALALLGRPANPRVLASLTALSRADVEHSCTELERRRFADRAEPGTTRAWSASRIAATLVARRPLARRKKLHRRIAAYLVEGRANVSVESKLEAVRHYHAAGARQRVVELGRDVAAHLKSTYQSRLAIEVYRLVRECLPQGRLASRVDVDIELAELLARTGALDDAVRLLRELLVRVPESRAAARRRVLVHLAGLHGRQGAFRRAAALFGEALGEKRGASPRGLRREEYLEAINEWAAVTTFIGKYDEADRLVARGLELATGRGRALRAVSLNLHATRANIALRRLRFAEAIADFEKALHIADAIASLANQAVVLNNLGKLYSQCDRFDDAIAALEEAERICERVDEGPSLAAIECNLALLYAKLSRPSECRRALAAAERLVAASGGPRERFFLAHARGLSALFGGDVVSAREGLGEAIALGRTLGDEHVAGFDAVYLAEALTFAGALDEAEVLLERAREPAATPRLRAMAWARTALLRARRGRPAEALAALAHAEEDRDDERRRGRPSSAPFLDAWDALYAAWTAVLCDRPDGAAARLQPAEEYFDRHGLRAGAELARLVRAEAALASGRAADVESILTSVEPSGHRLTAAHRPLLLARARLAGGSTADLCEAADLLAEARAALLACPLPEWEEELESLASELRSRAGPASLASPAAGPSERDTDTVTRRLERDAKEGPASLRASRVAHAAASRELLRALERVRGTDLPLLVEGETGSGKELVVRIIHSESARGDRELVVIDCAAIPEHLFELELFGAREGSFTDQAGERVGLLRAANGGTVWFDEVASLSLANQAKLLRALGERRVRPLGGSDDESLDVRCIFSTASDLERETSEGRFRRDLLYRVRMHPIRVPPLRRRAEDIPHLATRVVAASTRRGERAAVEIAPDALEALRGAAWPGNVRQLENVVSRLALECDGRITARDVDRVLGDADPTYAFPRRHLESQTLAELQRRLERDYIRFHFKRLRGDTKALCELLGLGRRQLYYRMKRLGITLAEERRGL